MVLTGRMPDRKLRVQLKRQALRRSLGSGRYPEYLGFEGPYSGNQTDLFNDSALDYLQVLWPEFLVDVIVHATNKYARGRHLVNWCDTSVDEMWTFFGIVLHMGIKRKPAMNDYWSRSPYLAETVVKERMSRARFWNLWRNMHVVDDSTVPPGDGVERKIKPVLDVLAETFFRSYSPSQELCVDEAMVKYKGRVKGKVRMPKKTIKLGFKIWCCACSCCGFLCTFRMYSGKPIDPCSGRKVSEKGLVKKVVKDLLSPFEGMNHVVYMDNFFNSGPLVDELAQMKIYVAGTIKQSALGFPEVLKNIRLEKGAYVAERVGGTCYYVFNDRKVVSFVSNVFPEHMSRKVGRPQYDGTFGYQSVPPLLPAYNKFMGAVDIVSQVRKTYGFDRKSKRYWLRLFFQFLDYAVNNAYLLYQHDCRRAGMRPVVRKDFRLALIDQLIRKCPIKCTRKRRALESVSSVVVGCSLSRVSEIGLPRGRCYHCTVMKRHPVRHTFFGCSSCKVRLCKIPCYGEFHQNLD